MIYDTKTTPEIIGFNFIPSLIRFVVNSIFAMLVLTRNGLSFKAIP
jgi:hypothetical protein